MTNGIQLSDLILLGGIIGGVIGAMNALVALGDRLWKQGQRQIRHGSQSRRLRHRSTSR
jgi:gas vesicle protein